VEGRDYHTVTRVGSWLYAIAGEKSGGGAIGSVERARVPSAGGSPGRAPVRYSPPASESDGRMGWDDAYGY
jgi:hypothetical protein